MDKIMLTIILIAVFFLRINAQWIQQQAPQNTGILLSVDFSNASSGVACGWIFQNNYFGGRIIRTTNGGNNWLPSSLSDSVRSCVIVQMINAQTGYIAGAVNISKSEKNCSSDIQTLNLSEPSLHWFYLTGRDKSENYRGVFLKTTDGGSSWYSYGSLPWGVSYLTEMKFFDLNTGYVIADTNPPGYPVGSKVLKTTNGGINWDSRYLPDSVLFALDMKFLDVNTGFVCGAKNDGAYILKTSDGGYHWSEYKIQNAGQVQSVDFINSGTGYLIAVGFPPQRSPALVYRTVNGGISWELRTSFALGDIILETVDFAGNSSKGIITGEDVSGCYILRTSNSGVNWSVHQVQGSFLVGTKLLDLNNWYVTGGSPIINPGTIILHSTNGGQVYIAKTGNEIPDKFIVRQNYPNPFNSSTVIGFSLPENSNVNIRIFDLLGREIAVIFNGYSQAGNYRLQFNASRLNKPVNSGIYVLRIDTEKNSESVKMMYVK